MTALRKHVTTFAENRPGIYRMVGPEDEVLYVGKSVRVRSRLLSYFRLEPGEKKAEMIREASRIEWEYVPNEFGALVREMRLIQRHRPPYNVRHKRKRSYAFIKITREPAPRIVPVARPVDDGSTYFGPFPRPGSLREAIRDLVHVLGLRDCPSTTPVFFGDQIEIFQGGPLTRSPRCMRADLGSCTAPCCGRVTAADYGKRVEQARRFLEGKTRAPLRTLEERMAEAAAAREFEYAALLRDRLERLRALQERLAAFRGRVESLTFLYRVPGFRGADRLYLLRKGRVREEAPHPKSRRARSRITKLIEDVYAGPDLDPGSLSPHEAAEILLVARWFEQNPDELKRAIPPTEWLEAKALL